VQNQFSPSFASSYPELQYCAEAGLAFLPWSPLGGIGGAGTLGGIGGAGPLGDRSAESGRVAGAHGVSPQQVALAWELALADVVIPIPGASRPESITDSVKAADLELTAEEVASLNAVLTT